MHIQKSPIEGETLDHAEIHEITARTCVEALKCSEMTSCHSRFARALEAGCLASGDFGFGQSLDLHRRAAFELIAKS